MFFDEKIIEIRLDLDTSEEVISYLSDILFQRGIVKKNFCSHVIAREKQFPTGLAINGDFSIAIPHTDSIYVNRPQIALATLSHPIVFKDMVDASKNVNVSLVFLIAMSNPHEQPQLLNNLLTMCQQPNVVKEILKAKTSNAVYEILQIHNLK